MREWLNASKTNRTAVSGKLPNPAHTPDLIRKQVADCCRLLYACGTVQARRRVAAIVRNDGMRAAA